jgi:hypothetical protein
MEKYNIKSDVESCHDIYRNYLQKTKSFQPKPSSFNVEEPSFHPKDRKEWIAARKTAKFYSRRIGRELKEVKEGFHSCLNHEEHQETIRLLKLRLDFALAIEHAIEVAKTSQSSIAEKEVLKLRESIFLIVSPSESRNLYDGPDNSNPDEDSSLTNSDNSTITSQEDNHGSSNHENNCRPVRVSGAELRDDYEMDNLYAHNNSKAYTDEELTELCIKSGLSPLSSPRCLSPTSPHSSTVSSPRSSYSSGKKTIGTLNRVIEEENDDSDAIEEEKDGERTPGGRRTRKSRRFAFIVPSIKDGPAVSLHEMKNAQKKVNSSVVLTMNNPLREKLLNLKEPEYDGDSSRPVSQSSFYSAATSRSAYSGSSASSNGDGMSYRIPELGKDGFEQPSSTNKQSTKNNKQLKKEAEQKRKEEEKRKKAEEKTRKQQEKEARKSKQLNKKAVSQEKVGEKKRSRSFSFGKIGKTLGKIFSFSASSGAKSDSEIMGNMSHASSRDDGNSSSDEISNDPNNAVVPVRWSSFSWASNTSASTSGAANAEEEKEDEINNYKQQQLMNSNGKKPSFAEMRQLAIKNNTRSATRPADNTDAQQQQSTSPSSSATSSPRTSAGSSSSSSATPTGPYDYETSIKTADSLLFQAQRAENSVSTSPNQLKWKEISKAWEECIKFCEKQFDLCCKSRDSEISRYRNEWNRKLSYMIKEKHRWNEKMKSLTKEGVSASAAAEGLPMEKPVNGNLSSFFFPEDHDDELEASYFPPSYSPSAVTSPANSRPSSMKWPAEGISDGNGSISSSEKKLKSKGSLRVSFKDDNTTSSPPAISSISSTSATPVSPIAVSLSPVTPAPLAPSAPAVPTRPIPSQAMLSPVPQPAVIEHVEPTELGKQQDKFQRNKMKRQLDKVLALSRHSGNGSGASPKAMEEVREKWNEVIAGFETSYHETLPLFKGFWKEEVERVKRLRDDSMTSITGKSLQ